MSEKPKDLERQLVLALEAQAVDRVIDVGANRGQYVRRLRRAGFVGQIHSFEPLPEMHAELERLCASDPAWDLAPPVAVGAAPGKALLHRSAESDMSSLLEQTELLRRLSPSSAVRDSFEVRVEPLSALIEPHADERLFLKIDVQGAEELVLAGLGGLWPHLVGIQLELALSPLYRSEAHYLDVCARLESLGFALALVLPGYFDGKVRRQLQFDGVFLRPGG